MIEIGKVGRLIEIEMIEISIEIPDRDGMTTADLLK